jgi:Beta-ketoacyl synthase, N-terminal domain
MRPVGVMSAAYVGSDYDMRGVLKERAPRRLDRVSEMAVTAAGLAFEGTGLEDISERGGVFFSTGQGNFSGTMGFLAKLHEKGAKFASPIEFPNLVMSAAAGSLSLLFRLKGELLTLTDRRSAGIQALCFAYEAVASGRLDVALAAGAEEMCDARSRCAELLGKDPATLGEGGAALVLTSGAAPVRIRAVYRVSADISVAALAARARDLAQLPPETPVAKLPGRLSLDVSGLMDAAWLWRVIASGEAKNGLCVEPGCAIVLEKA